MSETLEAEAVPAAPAIKPPTMTPATMVEKYVQLRDKKAEIVKRQKAELNPYDLAMGTLEAWLMDVLNTNGVTNMKAPAGTFYTTTRTSVTVQRWSETLDYIIKHEAWELLEGRVSKTMAEAWMTEKQEAIPGISVNREASLNVRRS
jgi:hypothetical protein